MKKQILLLIVFILTIGLKEVIAEDPPNLGAAITECLEPTEITATCVANAGPLNPIAGQEYTYTVNIPTPVGGKTYHWFVTTDLNFISSGVVTTDIELADGSSSYVASGGATYNNPALTATAPQDVSVDITWKAFTHDPTKPVLLVIYVQDDDCDNNNIDAYLIRPVHAFTLDIASVNSVDGTINTTNDHEICVSPVRTATYVITNAGTGEGEIQFDYGTNYMFFVVTAANFTDSWLPRFQVSGAGLTGTREISAVDWAYPADALTGTWITSMTGSGATGGIWTGTTPVEAQSTNGSVGPEGECIIVRITIENNKHETITDSPISLAVDGRMYDAVDGDYENANLADIHHTDGQGGECPWFDEFTNDIATQILTPRPDINAADPTPFVPDDRD